MSSAAFSRIDVEMTIVVFAAFAALRIYRHGVACWRSPDAVKKERMDAVQKVLSK